MTQSIDFFNSFMEKYPQAIFVSIHLNKFTASSAKGAQVFYSKNNPESFTLGDSIQGNIKKLLQPANERVIKQGTKSTYLLYNARIPAVIVECGFLSNAEDLKKLKLLCPAGVISVRVRLINI